MRTEWYFDGDNNLVFVYRARRFDVIPPRYMVATELLGVSVSARDSLGNTIAVSQQPSYVAALRGYRGWLTPSDLAGQTFVSLHFVPTLANDPALSPSWANQEDVDVTVDSIAQKLNVLQATVDQIQSNMALVGAAPVQITF